MQTLMNVPLGQGGEFFTQVVFTALATAACSSRVNDFLVIKKDAKSEKLRNDIKAELTKEPLYESQNQQYSDSHKTVEQIIGEIELCINKAIVISRRASCVFSVAAFFLLITGYATDAGCLPLLSFLPIGIARWRLSVKLEKHNNTLRLEGEKFYALRVAYEGMRKIMESKADAELNKAVGKAKSTSKTRGKKQGSTPICSDSESI